MFNKIIYQTRFLEIIPGALSWLILILPIIISAFKPHWVAFFIIAFDFYWLIKAVVFGIHLISGFLKIKRDSKIDWLNRLRKLKEDPKKYLEELKIALNKTKWFERKHLKREIREIKKAIKKGFLDWEKIYQAVILPTYKEPVETLRASLDSYNKSNWPNQKIIIVISFEKREGDVVYQKAEILKKEFAAKFKKLIITFHPDIVGELKAKGANLTWGTQQLLKYLRDEKIAAENVIVSAFDCDTRTHKQYFATLAYKYIINPKRRFRTFQPIPLYSNNIWHISAINRIVAFGSSFWQMIESTRSYRMINFSSQAMGLETLIDINFWDKTIVSEDSRQYYRAFFNYHGNHRAIPIFCPVYMDAVVGKNLWESLVNQYKQKRRWAWGIEHFPYFIRESIRHPEISRWEKFVQLFRIIEGHINWATASLLIAFTIWYPFLFNPQFSLTVLGFNLPIFARYLLMLTWIGIIISATISILLLPPKPRTHSSLRYIEMVAQWVLIPISAIFFGALPAIDAQTRLMTGKYLGFWVTPKEGSGVVSKI